MREFIFFCIKHVQLFFSDVDVPWQEVFYFARRLDSYWDNQNWLQE
jgi:hypothetical protein